MAVSESGKGKVGFVARITKFLKEVRSELRKVAWPSRKELTSYTAIVLVAIAAVAVFIGIIDAVVGNLVGLIF